jgi:predicted DNA-binding protein
MNNRKMKAKKFATQIDEATLEELRFYAKSTGRSISGVVSEAVEEYLNRAKIRPAFRDAMSEILDDNAVLLERLAK